MASPGLERLNNASAARAAQLLLSCCGSPSWAASMAAARPFASESHMKESAHALWDRLSRHETMAAFAAHPRIGDVQALRARFKDDRWAHGEQSGASDAGRQLLSRLAEANQLYLERFGYIFIIFATGKSAEVMLEHLERRLKNEPQEEYLEARSQQAKIIALRLQKLLISLADE